MQCLVCGSTEFKEKNYNHHVNTIKGMISRIFRFFSPLFYLFPEKIFPKLHAIASKPFKGRVIICKHCGYGQLKKIPEETAVKKYYARQYWDKRSLNSSTIKKDEYKQDLRAKYQLNFVLSKASFIDEINVLEIGGGAAHSLLYLKDLLRDKKISSYVCEAGNQWQKHYDFHKINRIADFFPFETKLQFDYIHTSHWLEHVIDMDDTIERLKKMLKPKGYLFVEVPNCAYDYWELPLYDTPHIHFFTPESLPKIFKKHGFNLQAIEETGVTIKEWVLKVKPTEAQFGKNEKGSSVRALFTVE